MQQLSPSKLSLRKLMMVYGTLAGVLIITINTINVELGISHVWLGFLVMFMALSIIVVAIKQQRDEYNGGVITFKEGFVTGIIIACIATVFYVLLWELYLHKTEFKFIEIYTESVVQSKQDDGTPVQDIAAVERQMEEFKQNYANPFIRLPMTALEIFPVGFLITLFGALLLRNHGQNRTNK